MIGYILLIVLCAGCWVLFGVGDKKGVDWLGCLGLLFALITTLLTIVATICIALRPTDAEDFRDDREYRQELVYAISDNMSPQTVGKIIASATYYNERIENNKKHCDSKMWGFMYNKGIAEVEPLIIPKIKYNITIEENASEE